MAILAIKHSIPLAESVVSSSKMPYAADRWSVARRHLQMELLATALQGYFRKPSRAGGTIRSGALAMCARDSLRGAAHGVHAPTASAGVRGCRASQMWSSVPMVQREAVVKKRQRRQKQQDMPM